MSFFDWFGRKVRLPPQMAIAIEAENLYVRELALRIGVDYYAETLAGCEWQVWEDHKPAQSGSAWELYYALNVGANPNQSGPDLKRKLVRRYFYDGKALLFPLRNHLYVADGFGVDEDALFGDRFHDIYVGTTRVRNTYTATSAYYFRQSEQPVADLVSAVGQSYGKLLGLAASSFRAGAGQKYLYDLGSTSYEAGSEDFAKKYREEVVEPIRTFMEADNGVFPLQNGRKLERLKAGDSGRGVEDVMELTNAIFTITGRAMHIPMSMMEGNTNTLPDVIKSFLTFGVDPLAHVFEAGLTRNTFTPAQYRSGCRVHIDTSRITHYDLFDVADQADKLISSAVACVDEVREALGQPPLNTRWSRAHVMTKNYDAAERLTSPVEGEERN